MNKLFTKVAALTLGVAMAAGVGVALGSAKVSEAKADDVTDTLTADKFAAINTTYTDFSNVSFTSSAVYAGNNGKTSSGGIQLRSKNSNSGIVTTVSGGNLKSISITVESGSNTLDVYGKTTAYSAASDLYNSGTQGTKIGSASATGSITLTNPSNYTYVGLRSNSGALYLTNITIVWTASQEGPTALDTPTLTKTDSTLSWTAVTNAASYELTVDGDVVYSGSDTTFSLSASQMAHGKHSASIVAKPASTDTEHKDSLAGETSWVVFDHEGTADDPYTVADAILAIDEGVTGTKYVTGTVSSIVTPYSSQYKNITFNFADNVTDTAFMQAFRCGGTEAENVAVGDSVVVSGTLKKYGSTYELDSGCQIVSRVTPQVDTKYTVTFNSNGGTDPEAKEVGEGLVFIFPSAGTKDGYVFKGWTNDGGSSYYQENDTSAPVNAATTFNGEWQTKGTETDPYNVAGARSAITLNAGIRGVYTTGIVKEIVTPYDAQYQNITFNIVDAAEDTDYLQVFRCKGDDASKVAVGDIVVVSGNLKLHDSTPEYDANCVLESLVTPVSTYDITYVKGEGTGIDYVVPGVEAGSSYTLVTFETAGFTAPEGQQFKGWQVGNDATIHDAGYELTVNGDVTVTAIYEDIPAQKFTITYKSGYGTGEDIVINDVEAGSPHSLKTFAETQFVAPAGQQFKGWQVGNDAELRAAGYEVTVSSDVIVTAIYEDIPMEDWSETFKTTFQSRFETSYLPPFVNAEFANESNQKWHSTYPYCKIEVEGNFYSLAANLFNNDSNWYFLGYDEYDCPIFMSADQNAFVIIDVYLKVQGGPVYTCLTFECLGDYAVVTTGATLEYYVGDDLDLSNVKLCVQLLDGTIVENLTIPQSYWAVSPTKLTEAGNEVVITITVAAIGAEFTYNVKVTPVIMESISISGELNKTEYTEGDAWDATGLVATAHYNNGTEEDVTAQVSWTFQPEETVAGTDSVSVVATLDEISSEAVNFDVVVNEPAPAYDADAFAKDLLDMVAPICANYDGKKNNKAALKTVWDTMSQRYSTLSNEEKAKVVAAAAKADGTDLEKAMAFYNYACKKYGLTKFIEGRAVKALVVEHETGNSILPIVVIVASSVAAITAIGVVIALKRRKALLAK